MYNLNFKSLLKIIVIPLIFLLSNCASNKVIETSKPVELLLNQLSLKMKKNL